MAKPPNEPLADIVAEARRLSLIAQRERVLLRLLGGLAIELGGRPPLPALRREYKDIDFVTRRGERKRVSGLMESAGYDPDVEFNTLQGHSRLLFRDVVHGRQVDVFVGVFQLCHEIQIAQRLELQPLTVPVAELLLTKLQIVNLNEKDQRDILALLAANEVADHDRQAINATVVARACARDWGLWRTTRENVEKVRRAVDNYPLTTAEGDSIRGRLDALWTRIESEPKPVKWKLRAKVGDRVAWYEQPDEVE